MDENDLVLFQVMATMASNTNDLFNSHEMEDKGGQSTDPTVGVRYVLGTMRATSTLFKTLTNFTLEEFDNWLLEWSLPLEPMLDPHVNFIFHI
jgi:hypothetical protein